MKCVVAGYGSRGDVEPCIAVAAELQRRGHEVRVAVTVPTELQTYVAAAGLVTVPYGRHWQDLLSDDDFAGMLQNPLSAIPQAVEYVTRTLAEKSATLTALAEDADLIVAGMTEQTPAANIAELQHIPLAALHFFPSQILHAGTAEQGVSTQADRAQRRALGLPEVIGDQASRPLEIQAYERLCVPRLADDWAGDERRPFVGTLTLELPTDTDDEVLSWAADGSPPVYFGFGSTPVAEPADMVATISTACGLIGTRALICLGPNDFNEIIVPENVKTVRDVNHAAVFPACRAIVHHGGAGTTAAGLRAGTPALILWNGLDQPMWAAALAHLGVGFGRRFSDTTLDSLAADLRLILAEQYAARAREIARLMVTPAESLTRTADLLEEAAGERL
ncbi:MAG: glycosyltransferase [Mycobacterium sp.]